MSDTEHKSYGPESETEMYRRRIAELEKENDYLHLRLKEEKAYNEKLKSYANRLATRFETKEKSCL